jgi:hypothetical protein
MGVKAKKALPAELTARASEFGEAPTQEVSELPTGAEDA